MYINIFVFKIALQTASIKEKSQKINFLYYAIIVPHPVQKEYKSIRHSQSNTHQIDQQFKNYNYVFIFKCNPLCVAKTHKNK